MKISNNILGLLICTLISFGCNKSSITGGTDNDITIGLDKSYIQFSSGISTRATLIEDLYLDDDFAVLGYQYRGEWRAAKLMAKPNVFYQDTENKVLALPQIVNYDDELGIYTYAPIQAWTGNNYSFFGHYPAQHSSIKLFDDGKTVKEGVPYITYTHPTGGDPTALVDVMTASVIETNIDFDSEVRMEMQHRLAAMDIRARNQYIYEEKIDELTTNKHLVTIEITKLVFKPRVYTKAKMYLDGSATEGSVPNDLSYTIVDNTANLGWNHSTFDIAPNDATDMSLREITKPKAEYDEDGKLTFHPTTILLIPQDTPIGGTLELSYKMKYEDTPDHFVYLENGNEVTIDPYPISDFNRILEAGYRYYIEITFTSDAVSINITAADKWDDLKEDVELEFE